VIVAEQTKPSARDRLVEAGIKLIRTNGYSATSVGQICAAAGVSKGAFFHHFASKEALAEACLRAWDARIEQLSATAPYNAETDPLKRLDAYMAYFIEMFSSKDVPKSCLVGTTVQEISESNAELRNAAQACFKKVGCRFTEMLDAAAEHQGINVDTASLARVWFAAHQGALVLAKASQDESVIPESLMHVRSYIRSIYGLK